MPADSGDKPQVSFTPEFKRNLRQLAKKYRHIKEDLQPLIDALARSEKPGDQVPRVQHEIFKVRVKNTDAKKGKSGGYRVLYWLPAVGEVVLITIYSKTEQEDVSPGEIRRIIEQHEAAASDISEEIHEPDAEHGADAGSNEA
jgi:mRNA-degrading endonuclease RelE of RelBE toxin-antitoxin system